VTRGEFFKKFLDFDYETGVLKWKEGESHGKNKSARYVIFVAGRSYPAQRVVWCMHFGDYPIGQIVHKKYGSRDPYDLDIKNYRDDPTKKYHGIYKGRS
jgi:hypothetical protein